MPDPKTHTLVVEGGALCFPQGNWMDPTRPSMLMRRYDAGDIDTCPWPMKGEALRKRLARALFDERETNDTFGTHDTVLLPDGTPFDFDSLVD